MAWTTTRTLACAPAAAWDVLVDTDRWPEWGPTVRAVDSATRRIGEGSQGRVSPLPGVWVPFRVSEWRPGRRWAWHVGGIPATAHEVRAVPGHPDRCIVAFEVPTWAPPYLAVCAAAIRRVERVATT